ncbi:hypothetical protein ERO13_D09G129250v2 [Gossypium hirsutum]|uniref:Uncharacterized protein n=1 Tax=Gossypium darwinii TaxID=34276 RepID=A0A5D2B9Y4_GOSDA|nr:hypothetical protein ERO13_D09G129250v2 [Gossypium hirsutum]TYG54087.1 hypothetical protein ES288_D09G161000v1 [Gossypium darwinii]
MASTAHQSRQVFAILVQGAAGGGRPRAWCALKAHMGSSGTRQGQGTLGFPVLFSFWAPMGCLGF